VGYEFAVVGGDGIGPEVVREGLKVLKAASEVAGFTYVTEEYPYSTDHYLETGVILPDGALDEFRQQSAIYVGAIGDPRAEVGLIERGIIAGIRFGLDLYVNLRPVKLYDERFCPIKGKGPDDVDFVVVRENTEDAYAGIGGILKKGTPDEVAIQAMIYTRKGCERVIRYAFELCQKRDRAKRLTLVDKANAIRAQDLFTRTFEEVGEEYPEIERDHGYVDAICMWLLKNPDWFDVMVTPNLFGDIVTDLGAAIQGGMGVAASGNIHPGQVSMFEPIHGSAPKYRNQNKANPIAAICTVQMMLDYVGEQRAAELIEAAVVSLLTSGRVKSLNAGVHGTDEIGDMVVEEVRRLDKGD
jgi:3-isopropylmalate dehydrogenase